MASREGRTRSAGEAAEDLPGSRLEREVQAMQDSLAARAEAFEWYALLVPPGKELVAQIILHSVGFASFVPVRREWRKRNRFAKEKEAMPYALAPRYLFLAVQPGANPWFALSRFYIVKGVIGHEGKPMAIPAEEMAKFVKKHSRGLNAPDVAKYMRSRREFSVGDEVEVIEGPFGGQQVPVVEITGPNAKIILKLFGSAFETQVPLDNLQRV